MQRKGTILTLSAICAGVVIALLRFAHTSTYTVGELPPHSFLTWLMSAAAIAAVAFGIAIAFVINRKKEADKDVLNSMASKRGLVSLVMQIAAAVLILVHYIISYPTFPEIIRHHNKIALITAILFAISHVAVSLSIYNGKNAKYAKLLGILSPLYFCLQLGEIFYANMANPVLIEYSYECLALGACALYLIAMAGSTSGKDQVFNIIATAFIALVCTPAAITGIQLTANRLLLYIAILLIILPNLPVYIKNLIPREKKETKSKKA